MTNEINLTKLANLNLTMMPSTIISVILLWIALSAVGIWLLALPITEAIIGALAAVALHEISGFVHQLGHAWAARRTGYPMVGVRLWGLLGTSVYPPDEPALPGSVHIRRALGGPQISLLLSLVAGAILLALNGSWGQTLGWVALFFFLDNLLVFTLGALTPLGFNDGSTLLEWRNKP